MPLKARDWSGSGYPQAFGLASSTGQQCGQGLHRFVAGGGGRDPVLSRRLLTAEGMLITMLPTDNRIAAYSRPGLWEHNILDSYLTVAARATPEQTAVVDRRGAWTYAQLNGLVDDLASALQALGVGRGDLVSWQLPNWVEAAVVHLAALRVGAISNPIVSIYRHAEVSFILRQAASKAMFVPATFRSFDYAGMLAEIRAELPDLHTVVVVGDDEARGDIGSKYV